VEEMELEEQVRDEGEASAQTRRNVWVDPYDGLHVPDVFPGGPSDTSVLTCILFSAYRIISKN
jgi:hypothetical protein